MSVKIVTNMYSMILKCHSLQLTKRRSMQFVERSNIAWVSDAAGMNRVWVAWQKMWDWKQKARLIHARAVQSVLLNDTTDATQITNNDQNQSNTPNKSLTLSSRKTFFCIIPLWKLTMIKSLCSTSTIQFEVFAWAQSTASSRVPLSNFNSFKVSMSYLHLWSNVVSKQLPELFSFSRRECIPNTKPGARKCRAKVGVH